MIALVSSTEVAALRLRLVVWTVSVMLVVTAAVFTARASNAPVPPATVLIKKAIKLEKGSGKPHVEKVGKLTRAQVEEIAKTKMKDLTAADLDAAVKTIAGSARSMGVTVEGV